MPHQWFEISLCDVFTMSNEKFLDMCATALDAMIGEWQDREIDFQARQYARQYLEMEIGNELSDAYGF